MQHAPVVAVKVLLSKYISQVRIITVALTAFVSSSFGQAKVIHQGSYWIRYYNQTQFTNKLMLNFHVDERRLINPSRQFQLFAHLHLNYLIKPWLEIGAGGNFNWTNSNQNENLWVPEWRPWQEVNLIKPLPRNFQFQFRYRLDERFIHNNDGSELLSGYRFNLRHRFRAQLSYTLNRSEKKPLIFRVSDEFMVNSGEVADTFDQNRIYASVQSMLSKRFSVEVGYLNIFQSRARDDRFYDRHVMRISIYHRVDLRKSTTP